MCSTVRCKFSWRGVFGRFDERAQPQDPCRNSLREDRSWKVDDLLGSPSLDFVVRHRLRHFLQLPHHLLHNLVLGALQDLVLARDPGHFDKLVLSFCSPKLRCGGGRCCTRSCEANLTASNDKASSGRWAACSARCLLTLGLNGLPSQLKPPLVTSRSCPWLPSSSSSAIDVS